MQIFHIASELAPLAKVGGLADVLLGLSREQAWNGHELTLIIPKYDCMDTSEIRDFIVDSSKSFSFYQNQEWPNTIWTGWVENLKVYFIEPHHPRFFFNRSCFYGCDDDIERFLYFSRAVVDFLDEKKFTPDIIHLHDWQTAAIPTLYRTLYPKHKSQKFVFTIHNIEYQGKCAPINLDWIGLDGSLLVNSGVMRDPYYPTSANLLKGAIIESDFFTTVSPTYAWEITTVEGGRGLDQTILQNKSKFKGILNGVDYSFWNPEIDRYLPAHFSSRELPKDQKDTHTLDKKAYIKRVLREKTGLMETYRPIVGCIARLVPQKGIEMIKHTLLTIADKGGQLVLLGSSPIPKISAEFQELKTILTDNPHVHLVLHQQEDLAHLIYAGVDLFIVPSLFEPCGLTQLISMKYGTIPIVRRTGGLADTVFDVDYSERPFTETNGYTFDNPDYTGIDSALDRAIHCWYHHPDRFRQLMLNAMNMDFSWSRPGKEYLEIYKQLIVS